MNSLVDAAIGFVVVLTSIPLAAVFVIVIWALIRNPYTRPLLGAAAFLPLPYLTSAADVAGGPSAFGWGAAFAAWMLFLIVGSVAQLYFSPAMRHEVSD